MTYWPPRCLQIGLTTTTGCVYQQATQTHHAQGAHLDPGRPLTAATREPGVAATPLTGNIDAAKSRYE